MATDLLRLPRAELAALSLALGDAVLVMQTGAASPCCALCTAWVVDGVSRPGWPGGRSVSVEAGAVGSDALRKRAAPSGRITGLGRPALAETVSVHVIRRPAIAHALRAGDDGDLGSDARDEVALAERALVGLLVCVGARVELLEEEGVTELEIVSLAPTSSARVARVLPSTRVRVVARATPPAALAASALAPGDGPNEAKGATVEEAIVGHRAGLRAQPGMQVLARVRAVCDRCRARATGVGPCGLRPPVRGLLLHGPPGTGKTHLVRTLVNEDRLPLVPLEASALGADDAALAAAIRGAFGAAASLARRASEPAAALRLPVLIFADELDALCEARGAAADAPRGGAAAAQPAATLACLLDSLGENGDDGASEGRLLFIGATNRLHAVEPLLLRAGRIDCTLAVALGTPAERAAVLRAVCASLPLDELADIDAISRSLCHGFSQADCAALCRAAALRALGRAAAAAAPPPRIGLADFEAARRTMRPTVLRSVQLVSAQSGWADVGGQEAAKARLQRAIEWPLTRAAELRALGVRAPRGVLLHGPPGCSKTLLARTVAQAVGCTLLHLSGASVYSPFVGEAEATIRATFQTAAACAPAIIFLDELDALVGARGAAAAASGADSVQARVLSTLLNELDGVERAEGVVLIGATNRLDLIDSALLRPGRLDELIEVGLPDAADRTQVLRVHTAKMPLDADVALELLAARTGGLSAADLAQLCVQAALCALHRGHAAGGIETVSVSRDDFERALETARPSAAGFETAPDPTRGGGLAAHENRALTTGGGNKPK